MYRSITITYIYTTRNFSISSLHLYIPFHKTHIISHLTEKQPCREHVEKKFSTCSLQAKNRKQTSEKQEITNFNVEM